MSTDRGKLGNFLQEVISWNWAEFCRAENDPQYTGYQSAVFSLVRISSEGKLGAIRLAIDRIDGKVETPVKIEYPKVYFIYPHANSVAALPPGDTRLQLADPDQQVDEPEAEEGEHDLATFSLRQTLKKMADTPREIVPLLLEKKKQVEQLLRDDGVVTDAPLVKSIIAANLLNLAQKNKFEAITEVFDQIDGKLVETYRVLGEDIFLTQYALEAPAGSVKNDNGVYQLEMPAIADVWATKFDKR